MPILDKWSKGAVTIVLSGDDATDKANALAAYGKTLPKDYVFHHDARSMKIVKMNGKEVLVGRMQVVPRSLNEVAKHVGSSSAARSLYSKASIASAMQTRWPTI